MKNSYSFALVGVAVIIMFVSIGYSVSMNTQVRELDRRLQHAEALLQSNGKSPANDAIESRIARLEQRVQQAELAGSQGHLANDSGSARLAERMQNIERNAKPRLEELAPYTVDR